MEYGAAGGLGGGTEREGPKGFLRAGVIAGQMSLAEPEERGVAPAPNLAVSASVRPKPRFALKPPRAAWANRGQAEWS